MFNGGILVGEVFKHNTRNIWIQVEELVTDKQRPYVSFDVLIGDTDRLNDGEADTIMGLREFGVLFSSCGV